MATGGTVPLSCSGRGRRLGLGLSEMNQCAASEWNETNRGKRERCVETGVRASWSRGVGVRDEDVGFRDFA